MGSVTPEDFVGQISTEKLVEELCRRHANSFTGQQIQKLEDLLKVLDPA